jgi:hypothetical protein
MLAEGARPSLPCMGCAADGWVCIPTSGSSFLLSPAARPHHCYSFPLSASTVNPAPCSAGKALRTREKSRHESSAL